MPKRGGLGGGRGSNQWASKPQDINSQAHRDRIDELGRMQRHVTPPSTRSRDEHAENVEHLQAKVREGEKNVSAAILESLSSTARKINRDRLASIYG